MCRLGSTRNMGIDGLMRTHGLKDKKTIVTVVADHPSMTGAACWISYKTNT